LRTKVKSSPPLAGLVSVAPAPPIPVSAVETITNTGTSRRITILLVEQFLILVLGTAFGGTVCLERAFEETTSCVARYKFCRCVWSLGRPKSTRMPSFWLWHRFCSNVPIIDGRMIMDWRLYCDFDGTIALEDVTDSILERFAPGLWEPIERDWKAGKIGSRECMARQVDLIRATRDAFDQHLDSIDIDPGFSGFVALCREAGVPLTVVSDGLDYAIHRVLSRHGLDHLPVFANHLKRIGDDRYILSFPHTNAGCAKSSGTCKCAIAARMTEPGASSLLIGDGTSDMCAAGRVDLVFAKDKLLDHCRMLRLPHVAFRDFADATRLMAGLLDDSVRFGVASFA
jgi:2,3-diketo-5-methylthio-1-phosphopentane phosphatase